MCTIGIDRGSMYIFKRHKKTKIGIAFGGGGARGFTHLGAIKAFEEYGIRPSDFSMIVGTSAGSIIGAFYASGATYSEMLEVAKSIEVSEIRTTKIPFMPSKTDGIEDIIKRNFGDINIEDLSLPFACVATDLKTTKEVVFKKGNLAKAVAGSCAVPGIFVPVVYENYHLADGGLRNNIPTNIPKKFGCDYVVGVDVNKYRTYGTPSLKVIDVLPATVRILLQSSSLRGYLSADVMIGPETKKFSSTRAKDDDMMNMIEEGYKETIDKMPQILRLLSRKPLKRKIKKQHLEEEMVINE
jgi:NTE family protein